MTPAKFIKTTIPEKETLGEKFSKKRSSLHIDLKEVEKNLRIPAKHLKLIEEDNYDKLPPEVYVRGFIKNYAEYLGLEVDKVLELYKKERGLHNKVEEVRKNPPIVKPMKRKRLLVTPKKMAFLAGILGVFGVVFFIGWQIKILAAPPSLVVSSPEENYTTQNDYVYVEGNTDPEAEVFINDVKIGTNEAGVFKERVSLQDGVNILKIKSQNKMNRMTQVERKILAQLPPQATTPDRSAYNIELKVQVGPKPVTLKITQDGQQINTSNLMLPGSTQTFMAKEEVIISTTNGGSTKIIFNGRDLGPLGNEGQEVKDQKFNKDGLVK